MLRKRLPALVAGLYLLASCGEGSDAPGSATQTGAASWCKASCNYTSRCTGPVSSTCPTQCAQSNGAYFSHVKDEFLSKDAACIASSVCGDWKTMTGDCYKSVAPTVTPTAAVIDFCKAMSAKFFECFYADDDLTFCAGDFAPWNDSGVKRAKACATVACDGLNDCLNSAYNGT